MKLLNVLKEWVRWIATWFVIGIFASVVISKTPFGRDDSDQPGWFGKRSGVTPVTDNLTGCQYLTLSSGAITPRLDASGHQIGCAR